MILHPLPPRSTQLKTGSNDFYITTCAILPKFYYACNITVWANSWHCLHIDPLVIEEVFDWLRFKITLIKQLPLLYIVAFHLFSVSKHAVETYVCAFTSRTSQLNIWCACCINVVELFSWCYTSSINYIKQNLLAAQTYFFHWLILSKIYFSSISYIMHYTRILNS